MRGKSGIEQNSHVVCDLIGWEAKKSVVLIRTEENSATLTPFGSLIRIRPAKVVSHGKSWTAKLRAVFASLFRRPKEVQRLPVHRFGRSTCKYFIIGSIQYSPRVIAGCLRFLIQCGEPQSSSASRFTAGAFGFLFRQKSGRKRALISGCQR